MVTVTGWGVDLSYTWNPFDNPRCFDSWKKAPALDRNIQQVVAKLCPVRPVPKDTNHSFLASVGTAWLHVGVLDRFQRNDSRWHLMNLLRNTKPFARFVSKNSELGCRWSDSLFMSSHSEAWTGSLDVGVLRRTPCRGERDRLFRRRSLPRRGDRCLIRQKLKINTSMMKNHYFCHMLQLPMHQCTTIVCAGAWQFLLQNWRSHVKNDQVSWQF